MIEINGGEHIMVTGQEYYGGKRYLVTPSLDLIDTINWVKSIRMAQHKEAVLRDEHPALNDAWKNYQFLLRMVNDDIR